MHMKNDKNEYNTAIHIFKLTFANEKIMRCAHINDNNNNKLPCFNVLMHGLLTIFNGIRIVDMIAIGMAIHVAVTVLMYADTAQCSCAAGSRSPSPIAGTTAIQRLFN